MWCAKALASIVVENGRKVTKASFRRDCRLTIYIVSRNLGL